MRWRDSKKSLTRNRKYRTVKPFLREKKIKNCTKKRKAQYIVVPSRQIIMFVSHVRIESGSSVYDFCFRRKGNLWKETEGLPDKQNVSSAKNRSNSFPVESHAIYLCLFLHYFFFPNIFLQGVSFIHCPCLPLSHVYFSRYEVICTGPSSFSGNCFRQLFLEKRHRITNLNKTQDQEDATRDSKE